jgi:tetratricopeptide (TPR) repeat protein
VLHIENGGRLLNYSHTAIVAGRVNSIRRLEWFAQKVMGEVAIYSLDYTGKLSCMPSSNKHLIFEEDEETPGYMANLEACLESATTIIAYQSHQFATFQALKHCERHNKALVVLCDDVMPWRYREYQNLHAIQQTIYRQAQLFIASNAEVADALVLEGVDPDAIRISKDFPAQPEATQIAVRKAKFLNHLKLPTDCRVVSFVGDENSEGALRHFLKAVAAVRDQSKQPLAIVLVGAQLVSEETKYEIHQLGIHGQTRVVPETPQIFLEDLVASSEIIFSGSDPHDWRAGQFPEIEMLAHAYGKAICLRDSATLRSFFGARGKYFSADSAASLLRMVELYVLGDRNFLEQCRSFSELLSEESLAGGSVHGNSAQKYREFDCSALTCSAPGQNKKEFAASSVEHLLSSADQLLAAGRMEEASELYGQVMLAESTNTDALKGLGFCALHASAFDEAHDFFKKVVALDPSDVKGLYGLGVANLRLNNAAAAVNFMERGWLMSGAEDKNINLLVQACLEHPSRQDALNVLVKIEDQLGQLPVVVNAMEKLRD